MPSLFENVGCNIIKLDQEDYKDVYNFTWEYYKHVDNKPIFTLQDFKDAYFYAEEESMISQQLNIK